MGLVDYLTLLLTHPSEFRTLIQYNLYHSPTHDITAPSYHRFSGWDRPSMRRCWEFLDATSRSFSAVIKELDGELLRPICLFYLVLRGLDTIEDDMTLSPAVKQELLREFYKSCVQEGWTFDGCGKDEKDRQLLVEFNVVTEELNRLDPKYRDVIVDICSKMGTGMADYAHEQSSTLSPTRSIYLSTIASYDLYCHYVAGLVGEGLSSLFSASALESPHLASQLELSNSMGLLLQKTNIIRDYREDCEQGRFFWPQEIWGSEWEDSTLTPAELAEKREAKVKGTVSRFRFTDLRELGCHLTRTTLPTSDPTHLARIRHVQSLLILDALRHAIDSLTYLQLLRNQSVFNFCAIPATMAISTLALCFANPDMYVRNVKIRRAEAANLIMRSTNPREVACIFREYARKIHAKASGYARDATFLRVSVACGKIEQWCEHQYPSFVRLPSQSGMGGSVSYDPLDARTKIWDLEKAKDKELGMRKRIEEIRQGPVQGVLGNDQVDMKQLMLYIGGGFGFITILCAAVVWFVVWASAEAEA